jgi:hypothetical protein
MTYASILVKTQQLRNFPGQKSISADIIDKIVENREKAQNRNRNVCKTCHMMTSTSKSCYCD